MEDNINIGTMKKQVWEGSKIDKSQEDKHITWLFIGLLIFCALMIGFMWMIKRSFH